MNVFLRFNLLLIGLFCCQVMARDTLQDPTRPPQKAAVAAGPVAEAAGPLLRLESVLKQGDKLSAVISGRLVHQGDKVEGYTVRRIERRRVILARDSEQLILELYQYEINRHAN